FGCGDAVIGVNPATDSTETVTAILSALDRLITAYKIPTQTCCLAHISTQLAALENGAPVDLLFQSIAGTEAANRSFGVTLSMLREGQERVLEHHKNRGIYSQPGEVERVDDRGIGRSGDRVIGKSGSLGRELTRINTNPAERQPSSANSRGDFRSPDDPI